MKLSFSKILVINVNWLGDVVFSLPVFDTLRKEFPKARIACLAVPRVTSILERCPAIDQILVFDEKAKEQSFFKTLKMIHQIKREQFDVAFFLHRSFTRRWMVALAGVPQRVGYVGKHKGWLLTDVVSAVDSSKHRSDVYLNVIESMGISVVNRQCQLKVDPVTEQKVRTLLLSVGVTEKDFIVTINPGGNWDLKRWPKENYSLLLRRLVQETKLKPILVGSAEDQLLIQEIQKMAQLDVMSLAGQLNLVELLSVFKRSDIVVTADSGPLHLASGVGANCIALFGPTRPEITSPRGAGQTIVLQKDVGCNRLPCYYLACPDNVCMKSLSVDEVFRAIIKK